MREAVLWLSLYVKLIYGESLKVYAGLGVVECLSCELTCQQIVMITYDNLIGIVGMHGAYGDPLSETLSNISEIIAHRNFRVKPACVGDWNVDQWPNQARDPW